MTAQSEFMLSKKIYERQTGRNQGKHDVIGYQIRQSFKPGEVTAQQALDLGYELAMRWTRGKHQFIVAAHINTDNPHTHIFFNSVTLDHSWKFQDFRRSAIALRRVSDKLCLEHGLSIIEKPGLSKGYNRAEYLGDRKPPTGRDKLREIMDDKLVIGRSLTEFLTALKNAGVEVKYGKQFAFRPPGSKKHFRQDTLGDDYSADAIAERLSGARVLEKRKAAESDAERKTADYAASQYKPSLLIDIQQKMSEGRGGGYRQWAAGFNLEQMSKTLMFLKEKGLDSYEELCVKQNAVSREYHATLERIKEIEKRQADINKLQEHIGYYGKAKNIYSQYKASGFDQGFFEVHRAPLTLRKAAKNYFDSLGMKQLPSINQCRQEWAELEAERRKLYSGYKAMRPEFNDLTTAKRNAETILFGKRTPPQKSQSKDAR